MNKGIIPSHNGIILMFGVQAHLSIAHLMHVLLARGHVCFHHYVRLKKEHLFPAHARNTAIIVHQQARFDPRTRRGT